MRSKLLWVLWCLIPPALVALHVGPGQAWLEMDRAGQAVRTALRAQADGDWSAAAGAFAEAQRCLPEASRLERAKLALAEAKAKTQAGEIVEGQDQIESLLDEELAQPKPDDELVTQLRAEIATTAYWTAWLMRLDGAFADEWLPEAETARQHFRLLAESADDPAEADAHKMNVEAVIRLEQMDLSELRALPLPKRCPNCRDNLCQQKRQQRLSKCKKPGAPKDGRKEIKTESAGDALERGTGS